MAEECVQRRLATILAAEIVGYSRMMREDEAGTLAQLKTLRKELLDPKVEEHGERIVKTTGDGVFVEFPIAVAAIRNAVKIQRARKAERRRADPTPYRINDGDVIVEVDDIR